MHVLVTDALTSASLTLWELERGTCFFASGDWLQVSIFFPETICALGVYSTPQLSLQVKLLWIIVAKVHCTMHG